MDQYCDHNQIKEAGRALAQARSLRKRRGKYNTLHYSMQDVADACGIEINDLYAKVRILHINLKKLTLKQLIDFINKLKIIQEDEENMSGSF